MEELPGIHVDVRFDLPGSGAFAKRSFLGMDSQAVSRTVLIRFASSRGPDRVPFLTAWECYAAQAWKLGIA